MKNKIFLIGYMGVGKTEKGKLLSKHLEDYKFVDTDKLVKDKACIDTITEIFESHSEEYFRRLESEVLEELIASKDKLIISTGGGIILREENGLKMKEKGLVFYLALPSEYDLYTEYIKNLKAFNDDRPLTVKTLDQLVKDYQERRELYEKYSHYYVKPELLTDDQFVSMIKGIVEGKINSKNIELVKI